LINQLSLKRFFHFLARLEEILLVFLLLLMVFLGFLQIFFRNVVSIGIIWVDPLQRHLVLWVALLGASIATREDRHITIDLLQNRLSPRSLGWIRASVRLFSAAVCFLLVNPAIEFVGDEYRIGKTLAFGIPLWLSQSIIPVMLVVIGVRFLIGAWNHLNNSPEVRSQESGVRMEDSAKGQ
jgi:TRAP-type C4-dicarboxylate transport system permease small subunit